MKRRDPYSVSRPILYLAAATGALPPTMPGTQTPGAPEAMLDLRDIKDILPEPELSPLWWWGTGAFILLIAGIVLFLYLKNRRQRQTALSAHDKALEALDGLAPLMRPETSREYAVAMADILRHYIEERFHLPAGTQTTREFLGSLLGSDEVPAALHEQEDLLKQWLGHCDLAKFARYRLESSEMEAMARSVRDFIHNTREEEARK